MVEIFLNITTQSLQNVKEKQLIMQHLLELVMIIGNYKTLGEPNGEKGDLLE
jgi:hypothetical protein